MVFSHMLFRFLKELEYVDELLSPDISCCVSETSYLRLQERPLLHQIVAANFIADPLTCGKLYKSISLHGKVQTIF